MKLNAKAIAAALLAIGLVLGVVALAAADNGRDLEIKLPLAAADQGEPVPRQNPICPSRKLM